MKKILLTMLLCLSVLYQVSAESRQIDLVSGNSVVDILVDAEDNQTVRLAADLFAGDIERVTDKKPAVKNSTESLAEYCVVIGSLEQSKIIRDLAKKKKIDVSEIKGQWEASVTQIVENPYKGVKKALVIIGSDRRGTAYGVFEVSKKIGVSPWYDFADVHPAKQSQLTLTQDRLVQPSPSVKYRGIFINDEMWGMRPWAFKTMAPHEGHGLGPTTYAKIFELLLRLKANFLWPAMHRKTEPFNCYPENKVVADKYAIVMGSSHCEPMLRNSIGGAEWDREHPGEDYNYATNKAGVYKYWEDALKRNGKYENIYTLGKRGKDDQPADEMTVDMLGQVIKDQRQIIKNYVNKDVTKVPQMMVFYTEVLNYYNDGLEVPDDVIFCWPDDNFGNIRQLPNAKEQQRSGGSGIYYHFQWINGATTAYPWLNTSPLGLTWYEMKKAYDYNAKKFWIVNVGDIKPYEISIDHFLSMAWDMSKFQKNEPRKFLKEWATYNFGAEFADEIADIWIKHTELGYARRPEHLVMYNRFSGYTYTYFSIDNYNDEVQRRIDEYTALNNRADALYAALPLEKKDAFYEMVLYNVKGAALQNLRVLYAQKSAQYGKEKRASAGKYGLLAQDAEHGMNMMINHYNTGLLTVGSKWNHMASIPGPWGNMKKQFDMPPFSEYEGDGVQKLQSTVEGGSRDTLPTLSVFNNDRRYVDLYNQGTGRIVWATEKCADWIKLSMSKGTLHAEQRVWVSVDWSKAPKGNSIDDEIIFKWWPAELDASKAERLKIRVNIFNPAVSGKVRGFVESNGYISMEAENFSRKNDAEMASWNVLEGVGRTGSSIAVLPTTIPAVTEPADILKKCPSVEYDIYTFTEGEAELILNCSANIPINRDYKLRYAYSIDGQNPVVVGNKKSRSTMENLLSLSDKVKLPASGQHTLKIWMVDPGLIVDKIMINTGSMEKSYLGPEESVCHK